MSEIEICDQIVESIVEERCLDYHSFWVIEILLLSYDKEKGIFYDVLSVLNEKKIDPKYLISCSSDKTFRIFNLQSKKEVRLKTIKLSSSINSLYFFPVGYLIAANYLGECLSFKFRENSRGKLRIEQSETLKFGDGDFHTQFFPCPQNPTNECYCDSHSESIGQIVKVSFDSQTNEFSSKVIIKNPTNERIWCFEFSKVDPNIIYFGGGNSLEEVGKDFSMKKFNLETKEIENEFLNEKSKSTILQIVCVKRKDVEYIFVKNTRKNLFILKNEKLIQTMNKIAVISNFYSNHVMVIFNNFTFGVCRYLGRRDNPDFAFSSRSNSNLGEFHRKTIKKVLLFKNYVYSCSYDYTVRVFQIKKPFLMYKNLEDGEDEKEREEFVIHHLRNVSKNEEMEEEEEEGEKVTLFSGCVWIEIRFFQRSSFQIPKVFLL